MERVVEILLEVGFVLEMGNQCVAGVVRLLSEVDTVSDIARVRYSVAEKFEVPLEFVDFNWSRWTA